MNFCGFILKLFGWKIMVDVPKYPKNVICIAPHTSNWDFILGKLAIHAAHRNSGFLMKEMWFFFPLGYLFKAMGGIPVPKKRGSDLVSEIVKKFDNATNMTIAVTPEGTRSLNSNWRTGFLRIAYEAHIPLLLAYIDFSKKEIGMTKQYNYIGDIDKDIHGIKEYYKDFTGKYPNKFSI